MIGASALVVIESKLCYRKIYTELRRIPILLAADLQPNQAGKYSNHNSVVFCADAGVFLFVFFFLLKINRHA